MKYVHVFYRSFGWDQDTGNIHYNKNISNATIFLRPTWDLLDVWINCTLLKCVFLLFCSRNQGEVICRNTTEIWKISGDMNKILIGIYEDKFDGSVLKDVGHY